MRRAIKGLAAGATLMLMGASAHAAYVPASWEDVYTPASLVELDSGNTSISFTHDITDDGFDVGTDWVLTYGLSLNLFDDLDIFPSAETAWIDLPGIISDEIVEIGYTDVEAGWSILGLFALNTTGLLDVTIRRLSGDFYFGGSELTAYGKSKVKVPEPGPLLLLGAGLAVAGLMRRRRSDEAASE